MILLLVRHSSLHSVVIVGVTLIPVETPSGYCTDTKPPSGESQRMQSSEGPLVVCAASAI